MRATVAAIDPCDELEHEHRDDVLHWIDSGRPVHRVAKPATPPKHLVAYALLVDPTAGEALLIDHRLAGRWLPTGGHVEPDEEPAVTARRELAEELGVTAPFVAGWGPTPFFVTVTPTVGPDRHVDVSLWFAFAAARGRAEPIEVDDREAAAARWWPFETIVHGPDTRFDPHLPRAITKLAAGTT